MNKNAPRISIAMATYNGARYIREQLDSLAVQTLLPCELVVTDDGSTDATLEIVADFASTVPFPVRIHRNEKRLGFADNFLYAASLCRGEFIAFCDQDDVWMTEKLATCAPAFTDPDVLLVMHAARVTGPDLTPTGQFYPDIKQRRTFSALLGNIWQAVPGFAIVFRTSLLGFADFKLRPFNFFEDPIKKIPTGHDAWVFFLSQSLGKTVFLEKPLANYRVHGANTEGAPKPVSLRQNLALSYRKNTARYANLVTISKQHVAALTAIESDPSIPSAIRLRAECARRYWERQERDLGRRAILYANSSTIARLSSFITLLARGAYRPSERGGFGLRGLAKDLVTFGLFWQRHKGESSTEAKNMDRSS